MHLSDEDIAELRKKNEELRQANAVLEQGFTRIAERILGRTLPHSQSDSAEHSKQILGLARTIPLYLENILESLPVGLLVVNSKGRITIANKSLELILGYTRDTLITQGWAKLFFMVEENYDFNQILVEVIHREHAYLHRMVPYRRPDGELRHLSVTSSFIKQGEESAGIVAVFEDVTEKHMQEEREKNMLAEKEQLQRERVQSLDKLAMSVAHQLRNPAMIIGGTAKILLKHAPPQADTSERLDAVVSESRRLERIVKAVSDYASLHPTKIVDCLLDELVNETLDAIHAKAKDMGLHLHVEKKLSDIRLSLDPTLFKRAITEIMSNTLEFSDNRNIFINLAAAPLQGRLRLSISDDGPGISAEDIPYIFDPFFTTKADGVGMGLTVAKRILFELNGDISPVEGKDQGSRFILRLPLNML